MNISLQNVDKVSAVLTVQIEKADYQEKVEGKSRKSVEGTPQESEYAGFPSGNGAHEFGEETIRYICIGRRS